MILCFASFRLTRLIVFDTITGFLRKPFHEIVEEKNEDGTVETYLHIKGEGLKFWIGELLSCYWCVGVWSSLFLVITYHYFPITGSLILVLAIAGVAAIIETIVAKYSD
ncbi:DUF1360 domain-containing protein [Anaerobacillus alkaliphilus]|uniref:DUF1360 domain-containing protein n=1 Tax=Anaerobacillus alkaliphilus TaxID=1548597 RepID=A0A4Q0VQL6_9BACI|nr:DUF1360 domain-containing protein [Anaerobacillus alkaliphilus]RXI98733.1 DUF1360 domain-containing protein [Anaerobacillus alkaliphilus]